jgi:hypothetical protein
MMFDKVRDASDAEFRRLIGVKRATFNTMVELVRAALDKKKEGKRPGGRPFKLSVEDRVLITLEYLHEYRTYQKLGKVYGLSESNAFENIKMVENILIKSKEFRLPGKKTLSRGNYSHVLLDATECPIQRPKKNKVPTIQEKRSAIR